MELIITIILFVVSAFLYLAFPKYLEKKAENLATKQDIGEITQITQRVENTFNKSFTSFSTDLKFKHDLYQKQYTNLYSPLYLAICHSESIRLLNEKYHIISKSNHSNKNIPFMEYALKEYDEDMNVYVNEDISESNSSENKQNNTVSNYTDKILRKNEFFKFIVSNHQYASTELFKKICTYQLLSDYSEENSADDEYSEPLSVLFSEIIITIIKDFNWLRKQLKLPYDQGEATDGKMNMNSVSNILDIKTNEKTNEEDTI